MSLPTLFIPKPSSYQGKQFFYAYELTTETSFEIEVSLDLAVLNEKLKKHLVFLQDNEIELVGSPLIGTVEATDVSRAIDKIRSGIWEYSCYE